MLFLSLARTFHLSITYFHHCHQRKLVNKRTVKAPDMGHLRPPHLTPEASIKERTLSGHMSQNEKKKSFL